MSDKLHFNPNYFPIYGEIKIGSVNSQGSHLFISLNCQKGSRDEMSILDNFEYFLREFLIKNKIKFVPYYRNTKEGDKIDSVKIEF